MILQSLSAAILIYIFVVQYELGVLGYFLSLLLSNILAGGIFGIQLLNIFVSDKTLVVRIFPLLKFGVPLIPASFAMYGMTTMDRWFIMKYSGSTELGKFAVASKIAIFVTILVEAFRTAWWPIAMEYIHSADGQK